MPITTLDKIRPMIHPSIATVLSKPVGETTLFEHLEDAAAIFIRDFTGIEIPDSVESTPDWLHLPAAYIIQHLALAQISEATDNLRESVGNQYQNALAILQRHPQTDESTGEETPPPDRSTSYFGTINNLETW